MSATLQLGQATAVWRPIPNCVLPDRSRDRQSIAYHEAAHAVLFGLAGLPVAKVEVRHDGGSVTLDQDLIHQQRRPDIEIDEASPMFKEAVVLYAACFYAGIQAEYLFHGIVVPGRVVRNDSDHIHADMLLQEVFCTPAPFAWAQQIARSIIAAHWPAVAAIAVLLEAGRTVTQTEVAQALGDERPTVQQLLALGAIKEASVLTRSLR